MLSKLQSQKLSKQISFCNCSYIKPQDYLHQEGNILISHHRQISQLVSLRNSPNKIGKISFNKPKTSLRASRVCRQKQNLVGNTSDEEQCNNSIINQLTNQTYKPTNFNRQPISYFNQHNNSNGKTSIFFRQAQQSLIEQWKKKTDFIQKYQKQLLNQSCTQNAEFDYKISNKKIHLSNTQFQQLQKSKKFRTQDGLSKQQDKLSGQMSSLIIQKKKTKVLNKLQLLQFKSTQSINDSTSVQNSTIISDIYTQQQNQNHSQRKLITINKLSQLLRTKYSRITQKKQ